jgi:hypothetical protein
VTSFWSAATVSFKALISPSMANALAMVWKVGSCQTHVKVGYLNARINNSSVYDDDTLQARLPSSDTDRESDGLEIFRGAHAKSGCIATNSTEYRSTRCRVGAFTALYKPPMPCRRETSMWGRLLEFPRHYGSTCSRATARTHQWFRGPTRSYHIRSGYFDLP